MSRDDAPIINREERLSELILEYIDAIEAGAPIDRAELLAVHADYHAELNQFFESRDRIERVAAPIRMASSLGSHFFPETEDSTSSTDKDSVSSGNRTPLNRPLGQLGEFQLLKEIGRGGMGIVYEAEQISLQRRVALKVLPFAAAIDAKHVLRFKNEALAAGMLNHPHIVPVYSVGNERGVHFYSMQLVEGQSLAALISELRQQAAGKLGHLPTQAVLGSHCSTDSLFHRELSSQHAGREGRYYRTAATLMLQSAEALHHAHESGIVHRDIKPANLLVDLSGQIHITDFGLAQIRSEVGLTRTGDTPGTVRYMSPEQAAGKLAIVDHRTDIYSLGATFYELLTLTPIFSGHDVQELLAQVFNVDPQPLRRLDSSIPEELEIIVLKATSKSPDDRFLTAGDLASDLRRYLSNEPILARRPSMLDRAIKWSRRHPSAVIASLVVLVLVSVISMTAMFLIEGAYRRERQRAEEAETQFQLARRSVDELVRVSEEELAYNQAAESVRRRLLTSVLAYYQEFIAQRRESPEAQESLAEASARVESILQGLRALQAKGQIKLLAQSMVAEELRLTEAQQVQARELVERVESLWHDTIRDIGQVSAAELDRRFVERSQLNAADLKALLSPDQLRRLRQLDLQADVAAAFREPEVIAQIKLSDRQRDQIRTIEQREMAFWRAMRETKQPSASENANANANAMPTFSKNDLIFELLTTEQKISWRELTGPPLEGLRR